MGIEFTQKGNTKTPPTKEETRRRTRVQVPPVTPDLTGLQRMIGNRAMQRMLTQPQAMRSLPNSGAVVQTKLTVNTPGDTYEQEADSVAKQVMSAPAASADVQRVGPEEEELQKKALDIQRAGPEEEELQKKALDIQRAGPVEEEELQKKALDIQRAGPEEEELQMKALDIQRAGPVEEEELQKKALDVQRQAAGPGEDLEQDQLQMKSSTGAVPDVTPEIEGQINASNGSGAGLNDSSRQFFESRFGQDFSNVHVHADASADSLNRSLEARAFTTGSDIYFRGGELNQDSHAGRELLAHELTHVVQQGGSTELKPKASRKCDDCDA